MLGNNRRRNFVSKGSHRRARRADENNFLRTRCEGFWEFWVFRGMAPIFSLMRLLTTKPPEEHLPSSPNSMHAHPLSNIDNQFHIRVIIVVCAARDFHILICHADVVCIGLQILRRRHDRKLNRLLIAECLVGPFPHRSDLLDGRNTVVGNQDLSSSSILHRESSARSAYVCDDGVTIVVSHEVLNSARSSLLQSVAANEVVGEIVLRCIASIAVQDRHGAVGVHAVAIDLGHHAGVSCSLQTSEGTCIVASRRERISTAKGLW